MKNFENEQQGLTVPSRTNNYDSNRLTNYYNYDSDSDELDYKYDQYPSGLPRNELMKLLQNFQSDIPSLPEFVHYFESEKFQFLIKQITVHKSLADCRRLLAIYIRILSLSHKENNRILNMSIMYQKLCVNLPSFSIAMTQLIELNSNVASDMPLMDAFLRYFHDGTDLILHCNTSVVHQTFDNIVEMIKSFYLMSECGKNNITRQDLLTRLPLMLAELVGSYFKVLITTKEKINYAKLQATMTMLFKYSKELLKGPFIDTVLKCYELIEKNGAEYLGGILLKDFNSPPVIVTPQEIPEDHREFLDAQYDIIDDDARFRSLVHVQMAQLSMLIKGQEVHALTCYRLAIVMLISLKKLNKKDIENLKKIYILIQQEFKNISPFNFEFMKIAIHCFDNKVLTNEGINKCLASKHAFDMTSNSDFALLIQAILDQFLRMFEKENLAKLLPNSFGAFKYSDLMQLQSVKTGHLNPDTSAQASRKKEKNSSQEEKQLKEAKDNPVDVKEETEQLLNNITNLFLKGGWQRHELTTWKAAWEFKSKNEIIAGMLTVLKKSTDYQHLKSLTFKDELILKVFENKLLEALKVIFKEQGIKIQEGMVFIDINKRNKHKKINVTVDEMLKTIYQLSDGYQINQLEEKRKKLPVELRETMHDFGELSKSFKELLVRANKKDNSSWSKTIERARLRSKNTEGKYLRAACKVINLVEEITQLSNKFDEQFQAINLIYNNLYTDNELLSKKMADQIKEQDYNKIEEMNDLMKKNMKLLKDLYSKLQFANIDKLNEKLEKALNEFVQIFDNDDKLAEFHEDKSTDTEVTKELEKKVTHQEKQKDISNTSVAKLSLTDKPKAPTKADSPAITKQPASPSEAVVMPKKPPAPSEQPNIQIFVRQSLFAPPISSPKAIAVTKANEDLLLQPSISKKPSDKTGAEGKKEKQITPITHRPVQQPSELTNQELLQELKKLLNNIKIQWEKYLNAVTTNFLPDKIKAGHNISLNFLHFCHGLWLMLIVLEKLPSSDSPDIYFQLRTRVRDIRSILAKLPKDFSIDALYNSIEIFFNAKCLSLIDTIAAPNQQLPLKEMLELDKLIQKTDLYQLCKKSLDKLDNKEINPSNTLMNNDEKAQYYLLQIGESMHILHSIAKSGIKNRMDLHQPNKREDVVEVKMLIIIIGKYAELLQKSYSQIFHKLQNEKMHNYFTKAINYSKQLRHPLRNKSAEIDMENIWRFILQTESDEIQAVSRQLTTDLSRFTSERPVELQPVLSKSHKR